MRHPRCSQSRSCPNFRRKVVWTLTIGLVAGALSAREGEKAKPKAAGPEPVPSNWTTEHVVDIAGEEVSYEATVDSIILRDDAEQATAELFYTAYFRTNGGSGQRPLLFSFNGGYGKEFV